MPYSISLTLRIDESDKLKRNGLQGIFVPAHDILLFRINRYNPDLAKKILEQNSPRPYTTSWTITDDAETTGRIRITLLDDALWPAMEHAIVFRESLSIKSGRLMVDGDPKIEHISYEVMIQESSDRRHVGLQFDTPTTFRTRELIQPLPDPILVFRGLSVRWNAYAPHELHVTNKWLQWLYESVALIRLELSTGFISFGDATASGFVGKVEYQAVTDWLEGCKQLNTLGDFAYYSGVGIKTALGMGQTKRLTKWESTPPAPKEPKATKEAEWNTAALRELINAGLNDGELTTLCFDYFRTVYEDFASGMTKGQKIQLLLDYCARRLETDALVSIIRKINAAQYKHFEKQLKSS